MGEETLRDEERVLGIVADHPPGEEETMARATWKHFLSPPALKQRLLDHALTSPGAGNKERAKSAFGDEWFDI